MTQHTASRYARLWTGLTLISLILSLSACSDEPPPAEIPEPEALPMTQPSADRPEIEPAEHAAVQDLAARVGIAAEEIEILSAQAVTWSDGAIGCPEPEGLYTQALVPGFHVVLEANGEEFHYHAGRDASPFLCPEDRRRAPMEPGQQSSRY